MKYFVTILLALMLMSMGVNAAVLDDVTVTTGEKTLITVSGNEECANIGDAITVYVVPCQGDDIPEESDDVEYVDIISINRKEEFTHTFKFDGSIGKYAIGVKAKYGDGDYVVKTLYTKNEIDRFAYDIRDKKFSESELVSALAPYVDLLGFSSERLDDSRDISLLTDVLLSSERLEISNGFEDLVTIVDGVKEEWELIDLIEDTKYWFDIAEAIDDNRELLGVDKKWSSYKYKEKLCTELLDYTVVDLASLGEDINELMKSLATSSGGSSGGGRGGSVSVSVAAGTSAVITPPVDTPVDTPVVSTKDVVFVDIKDVEWAETAILNLAEKGVLNGVGDNCFAPDLPVKREELAKILVLAFDIPMSEGGDGFNDVSAESWYADYVYALCESGISKGVSDSKFGVGLNVSRQDMATLLYRLMASKGFDFGDAATIEFNDSADIAEYALVPVHTMAACGVINGVGDHMFDPTSDTTRAQTAKLIYEVVKVLEESGLN